MGDGDRVGDRREGLEQLAFLFKPVVDDQHSDLTALVISMKHRAGRWKALVQCWPRLYVRRYKSWLDRFAWGCHADFGIERQLSRSGPSSLRKVTFGVGLEAPSDSPDPIAFVSAPAFLAEERFELLDHVGDRHGFEACDLGRRCSVHG